MKTITKQSFIKILSKYTIVEFSYQKNNLICVDNPHELLYTIETMDRRWTWYGREGKNRTKHSRIHQRKHYRLSYYNIIRILLLLRDFE